MGLDHCWVGWGKEHLAVLITLVIDDDDVDSHRGQAGHLQQEQMEFLAWCRQPVQQSLLLSWIRFQPVQQSLFYRKQHCCHEYGFSLCPQNGLFWIILFQPVLNPIGSETAYLEAPTFWKNVKPASHTDMCSTQPAPILRHVLKRLILKIEF